MRCHYSNQNYISLRQIQKKIRTLGSSIGRTLGSSGGRLGSYLNTLQLRRPLGKLSKRKRLSKRKSGRWWDKFGGGSGGAHVSEQAATTRTLMKFISYQGMVCHYPNCGNLNFNCSNVCEVASGLLTQRDRHNWTNILFLEN